MFWRRRPPAAPAPTVADVRVLLSRQRGDEATGLLDRIIAGNPLDADAQHLRALLACHAKDFDLARVRLAAAIEADPAAVAPRCTVAEIELESGHHDAAVEALQSAAALAPDRTDIRRRLVTALALAGRQPDALRLFALGRLLGDDWTPATHPAVALFAQGRLDEARAWLERAVAADSSDGASTHLLGVARQASGRVDEAIATLERAAALDPTSATLANRLGFALDTAARLPEAAQCYRRAVDLDPANPRLLSDWLTLLHFLPGVTRAEQQAGYELWNTRHGRPATNALPPLETPDDPERVLRIGYVGADFFAHVSHHFMEPVLEHHDRQRFEVFCYDGSPIDDAVTAQMRRLPLTWRSAWNLSDDALAAQIRHDRIDILVDLNGHLRGGRLGVFAGRAAPVQVTWLGYPNTTGITTMDAWITDRFIAADLADQHHTETLWPLDGFYMPFRPGPLPSITTDAPAARHGHVTFGSFNLGQKLNDAVFDAWARILERVPGARLVLFAVPESAHTTVRRAFEARDVAADRVTLADRLPHDEFLRAHNAVDIALDPFPCVGTTTTLFSLAMGVPIVTLVGHTHASRVTGSILNVTGFDDWIAGTPADYVDIALRLAHGAADNGGIRQTIRDRLFASAITDEAGFTRRLEAAFREMWRRRCGAAH